MCIRDSPVSFYMQIKTETYGKAKIVKTSEDGIVEGIPLSLIHI